VSALEKSKKAEEDARDQKGATDAHKKTHQAAADALEQQIDAAKKEVEATTKAFVASCESAAAKVPAQVRDPFAPAIVNLRRAVHDAKVANIAATARYPFLVAQVVQNPAGLKDELITAAKGNASDVLYEQVGKRLKIGPPVVVFDAGKVDVTLNGLAIEDLGKLTLPELMTETTARTGKFALEAVTLPLIVASTEEKLDFEADVLDGIKDGFRSSGGNIPAPAEVTVKTSIEIQASAKAKNGGIPNLTVH
jgi:vacuolar-type H+-ATPase subunit E/Vma4